MIFIICYYLEMVLLVLGIKLLIESENQKKFDNYIDRIIDIIEENCWWNETWIEELIEEEDIPKEDYLGF